MIEQAADFLRKHGLACWTRPPEGLKTCSTCDRYYNGGLDVCPYC